MTWLEYNEALQELRELARNFPIPDYGRYVREPAQFDEDGIAYVPPPVPDPVKRNTLVAVAGVSAVGVAVLLNRRIRTQEHERSYVDCAA